MESTCEVKQCLPLALLLSVANVEMYELSYLKHAHAVVEHRYVEL